MAWMIATRSRRQYMAVFGVQRAEACGLMKLTLSRRVLAEVLRLVAAQDTGSLDLGGRASGQLLVEVDDALHCDSIGVGAESLNIGTSSAL